MSDMSERGDEEIRRRAYERYIARGDTPGDALDDWLAAEQEVREPRADDAPSAREGGDDGEAPRRSRPPRRGSGGDRMTG